MKIENHVHVRAARPRGRPYGETSVSAVQYCTERVDLSDPRMSAAATGSDMEGSDMEYSDKEGMSDTEEMMDYAE